MKTINQEFNCSISVAISPREAFNKICRISEWWVKDVEGTNGQLHDVFTVYFGTTWVAFKVTDFVPDKTAIWTVMDCNLPWNGDVKEWNGTYLKWEISEEKSLTKIAFSHIGLAELDCSNQCMNAWSSYIMQSLFKLITEGKGLPNKF